MKGLKVKLAHRRAGKGTWSSSDKAQRRRLVKLLEELIALLERDPDDLPADAAEPSPTVH